VALELMKRGHTITWIAPFNDEELQGMMQMKLAATNVAVDSVVNSTEVFQGIIPMNFNAFINTAVQV